MHVFHLNDFSLTEKQYEEHYKGNANIVFLSNAAHLIALSIDSVVTQTGGLKSLLSLSTKKLSKVNICMLGIMKVLGFQPKNITQKPVLHFLFNSLAVLVRYSQAQKCLLSKPFQQVVMNSLFY